MGDLQILQNKAAKLSLICLAMPHPPMHSSHLAGQRRLVNRYVITFKVIHGLVDCDFNILRNSDIHSYNTRRKNDFRLPRVRTNYGKKRLLYQSIKEWNLLEQSFKGMVIKVSKSVFLASF